LRRSRDRYLSSGGAGNTPFSALKTLAQRLAAAAATSPPASAAPSHNPSIQVASILNRPSGALLNAVRNKSDIGQSMGTGDISYPGSSSSSSVPPQGVQQQRKRPSLSSYVDLSGGEYLPPPPPRGLMRWTERPFTGRAAGRG
jgi:hypothetical protein